MTISKITLMLNDLVGRKNYATVEDVHKNPLLYVDYLVAIREELGDQCSIAGDKMITSAINTLIHLNATQLKAAIKAHRRACLDEFLRRFSK